MNELKVGQIYRVRITDDTHQYFSKTVKVLYTGLVFRSTEQKDRILFYDQVEVIEEAE